MYLERCFTRGEVLDVLHKHGITGEAAAMVVVADATRRRQRRINAVRDALHLALENYYKADDPARQAAGIVMCDATLVRGPVPALAPLCTSRVWLRSIVAVRDRLLGEGGLYLMAQGDQLFAELRVNKEDTARALVHDQLVPLAWQAALAKAALLWHCCVCPRAYSRFVSHVELEELPGMAALYNKAKKLSGSQIYACST